VYETTVHQLYHLRLRAQGTDAWGLRRCDVRARDGQDNPVIQPHLPNGVPENLLQVIEFKKVFVISSNGSNYNHSFLLTDYIIAWDVMHEGKENGGGTLILDDVHCTGNAGRVYTSREQVHRVPDSLSSSTFIHTIRKWDNSPLEVRQLCLC